ncbi:MAG: spermidine/putrescine ABC transporter substrate-binding protein PotD, partial [Plesiomonas sp.]
MKRWSRLLVAGMMALGIQVANAAEDNVVYFYNWSEYIPSGLLEEF